MDMVGVYAIRRTTDGACYVGSAELGVLRRRSQHFAMLVEDRHHSPHLQRSWNKHGRSFHEFIVLENVDDKTRLLEREQFYIDTMDSRFNVCRVAGSSAGYRHTDAAREKMRAKSTGKKRKMTPRWRRALVAMRALRGPITEETRAKLSVAHTSQRHSEAMKEKIRQSAIRRWHRTRQGG